MPSVFHNSKINLNITLKTIQTGIPLRAWDILGCGGFLLSNFQQELCEYFIPGEDFIYYESIDDATEKAAYFLTHENERKEIAHNAFEKIAALIPFITEFKQCLTFYENYIVSLLTFTDLFNCCNYILLFFLFKSWIKRKT